MLIHIERDLDSLMFRGRLVLPSSTPIEKSPFIWDVIRLDWYITGSVSKELSASIFSLV